MCKFNVCIGADIGIPPPKDAPKQLYFEITVKTCCCKAFMPDNKLIASLVVYLTFEKGPG